MPPPIQEPVRGLEQVVDDRELVENLRAAEHHGIRPLGALGEPLEHAHLGLHQAADRGGEQAGDVVDGGLLRWTTPKPSETKDVREGRQLAGERAPLLVGLGRLAPKRRFSSSTTSPSWAASTVAALPHRVGGEGDVAVRGPRRGASPRGRGSPPPVLPTRPRWAHTMTRAPASDSADGPAPTPESGRRQ